MEKNGRPIDDTTPLFCNIESARNIGDHVEYNIRVQRGYNAEDTWIISRRYKDFETLYDGLKPASAVDLTLPPKKLFGNMSHEFIAERQLRLQMFLETILSNSCLSSSLYTKRFLYDDKYTENFQELALQHISMFLRSEPDWEIIEPVPDMGWRIRKSYFMVRNVKLPKEKFLLSWTTKGPYCSLEDKERIALLKTLSSFEHMYLLPIKLSAGSSEGAIMIRPFLEKGALRDQLCKSKPKTAFIKKYTRPKSYAVLSVNEMKVYGRQILEFMQYMHEKNFPLGNVHPGNIFIQDGVVKISDIENCVLGVPSRYRPYFSLHKKINTTERMDAYAFGHILYEMCFGYRLSRSSFEELPANCPSELRGLLERLLAPESLKIGLPSTEELLSHSFFKDVRLPQIPKPLIKMPSKLKDSMRCAKQQFELLLQEEQHAIHQVKVQTKIRAHHMSDEEKRKRLLSQKMSSTSLLSADPAPSSSSSLRASKSAQQLTELDSPGNDSGLTFAAPSSVPSPPPPPPASNGVVGKTSGSAPTNETPQRGALLDSISGFSKQKLKRAATVDKSAPRI